MQYEVIHTVSFTMSNKDLLFRVGGLSTSYGSLYNVIRETGVVRNHCLGYRFLDIVGIPNPRSLRIFGVYRYILHIGTFGSKN